MMIGEDDISNDVITLGTCRLNVCLHSRSLPPRADWRKSDSPVYGGATREYWWWNSNSRDVVRGDEWSLRFASMRALRDFFGSTNRDKKFVLRAASIEQLREYNSQAASTSYILRFHMEILFF